MDTPSLNDIGQDLLEEENGSLRKEEKSWEDNSLI
jgi:hypothetical protein